MHHANLVQLILCFVLFKVKVHLVSVNGDDDGGGGVGVGSIFDLC